MTQSKALLLGGDGLDAILLANWLALCLTNIGIIAGARVNFLEPFHISTAIATLDYVNEERAGNCSAAVCLYGTDNCG